MGTVRTLGLLWNLVGGGPDFSVWFYYGLVDLKREKTGCSFGEEEKVGRGEEILGLEDGLW